jgi:hypothetical protein
MTTKTTKTTGKQPHRFYKWVVEIEVEETWVADGFNLTQERLKDMLERTLDYSYEHETRCKILKAPTEKDISDAGSED